MVSSVSAFVSVVAEACSLLLPHNEMAHEVELIKLPGSLVQVLDVKRNIKSLGRLKRELHVLVEAREDVELDGADLGPASDLLLDGVAFSQRHGDEL